jgi:TnpA family transposase
MLTQPINWALIRQHYDEMIKYTTALRLGTAEPESIGVPVQSMQKVPISLRCKIKDLDECTNRLPK